MVAMVARGPEREAAPAAAPAAGMSGRSGRPSRLQAWWLALRPKTLLVSLAPVLVGSALAYAESAGVGSPRLLLWPALLALLAALFIQIGTNLHNDVADCERGADPPERLGPARATAMGWLSAGAVRRAALLAFGLAFLIGVALVARGGWPIVIIGIASLIAGWAYTGGPRPIAYGPLGEFFVVAFFGFAAVGGSYYLQRLSVSPAALLAGLQIGLLAAAVISVNNTRDIATDRAAGRRTLAVRLGRRRMQLVYGGELLLPFALLPLLAIASRQPLLLCALVWLLPAMRLQRRFAAAADGAAFNALLAASARLQAGFAVVVSLAALLPAGA